MSEKLLMWAYYYGFEKTGVPEIDKILSAVACAGKAHHHTGAWESKCSPFPGHSGETPESWIQHAANKAAEAWNTRAAVSMEALADYEKIARAFHDVYELMAPHYRWQTQEKSAVEWEALPDNQRQLMLAVVEVVVCELIDQARGGSE